MSTQVFKLGKILNEVSTNGGCKGRKAFSQEKASRQVHLVSLLVKLPIYKNLFSLVLHFFPNVFPMKILDMLRSKNPISFSPTRQRTCIDVCVWLFLLFVHALTCETVEYLNPSTS